MPYVLSVPFGILLGIIVYKTGQINETLAYFVGILPYSIFFWLYWNNQALWGPYRFTAFIATIITTLVSIILSAINDKKSEV